MSKVNTATCRDGSHRTTLSPLRAAHLVRLGLALYYVSDSEIYNGILQEIPLELTQALLSLILINKAVKLQCIRNLTGVDKSSSRVQCRKRG